MAGAIGRGRGRGRGLTESNIVELRRPIHPQTPEKDHLEEVVTKLEGLSNPSAYTNEDGESDKSELLTAHVKNSLSAAVQQLSAKLTTGEKIKHFVNNICNKCMDNTSLIRPTALLMHEIQLIEADDIRVRNVLLSQLQNTFKDRDSIYQEKKERFLNNVVFLGEVFQAMTTVDGNRYLALSKPLLTYFTMCVDESTADFVEAFKNQFQVIGQDLNKVKPDVVQALMETVRTKIIADSTDTSVRIHLLHCLEMYLTNWKPLPVSVSQLYNDVSKNKEV